MKLYLNPRINLLLYGLLLILTPFLLLQNYLQEAIGMLSNITFRLGGKEIPLFMILVSLAALAAFILILYHYSPARLTGLVLVLVLLVIGYSISDYYFNQHFYDIQHNWHYFAYGIYTWLAWDYFFSRGLSTEKIILYTFLYALGISLTDEIIQVFISHRVFDLSDVAKDVWGCLIGQVFIHFVIMDLKYLDFRKIRLTGYRTWLRSGSWILLLEFLFALIFLSVASVLTDRQFAGQVVFITLGLFLFGILLLQLSGTKKHRRIVLILLAFLVGYPTFRLALSKPHIHSVADKLIVFKGIPLPYFDYMVYSNGLVRPVDKKTSFNMRDIQKICSIGPDILILATGSDGSGGLGFNDQLKVEMRYNHEMKKVYQVIKLTNAEAFQIYNRLAQEGKNVLMVIHNS